MLFFLQGPRGVDGDPGPQGVSGATVSSVTSSTLFKRNQSNLKL